MTQQFVPSFPSVQLHRLRKTPSFAELYLNGITNVQKCKYEPHDSAQPRNLSVACGDSKEEAENGGGERDRKEKVSGTFD